MKKPLIVLTGPTAVGKTSLSIALAKAADGEIISADSMQVYKHMDIGSAKITKEEMEGVPHYLIDVLEPSEEFHVVRFQEMAKEAMEKIYSKGKIPILTGGTGFYIQAVVKDIDFSQDTEKSSVRAELEKMAEEKGGAYLHQLLEQPGIVCHSRLIQLIQNLFQTKQDIIQFIKHLSFSFTFMPCSLLFSRRHRVLRHCIPRLRRYFFRPTATRSSPARSLTISICSNPCRCIKARRSSPWS